MAIQKISNAVIADNAIDSDNLVSGAVNAADITDGSITTAKLADDSITNAKIAPNSVTSTEIAAGSVTYNQIADGTIITSKIADSQITPTKIDSAGSYTVGNITSKDYILQGISTDIASTAVDIFIYDTSKDSDGGEWRNRTQDTSWYNETLNTATRGSRREFPAVAVIVATTTTVTIYDGDDTSLPMWMVFDGGYYKDFIYGLGNGPVTAIQMLNAKLCVTIKDPSAQGGLDIVDFISDSGYYINESTGGPYRSKGNIKTRNDGLDLNVDRSFYNPIISRQPNDVSMTVLPNAPIDDATGLPIPTIAVATDGGVSVIRDNGQVFNITNSGAEYNFWSSVNFTKDYKLIIDANYNNVTNNITHVVDIPESNVNQSLVNQRITALNGRYYHYDSSIPNLLLPGSFAPSIAPMKSEEFAMGADNGNPIALNIISEAPETVSGITSKAMVAYIGHDYNTGHMVGDIRGAWLSDTNATNNTGGTELDRSVKGNHLQVTGTITKTAVASGAELVSYSGFSDGVNYLQKTPVALNFGSTGTICIMGWQKITDISDYSYIASIYSSTSSRVVGLSTNASGAGSPGTPYLYDNTNSSLAGSTRVDDGQWHLIVGVIDGTFKKLYVDGALQNSQSITSLDLSNVNIVGVGHYTDAVGGVYYSNRGNIALVRITATAPSDDQIKKIYEDEKFLFQEGAQAALYGSSNAVTALAYDNSTELLHVGTSAGRSVFQGLRRVQNTTTAVSTAISANNELVAEQ